MTQCTGPIFSRTMDTTLQLLQCKSKSKPVKLDIYSAQSSLVRSCCSLADTHSLSSEEIGFPRQEDLGRIAASSLLTCKLEAESQYSALTP